MDDGLNWEGAGGFGEHHTVGAHRARCFQCSEWCAEGSLCECCDQVAIPDRWRGLNVGDVLTELKAEVETMMRQGMGFGNHGGTNALQKVLDSLKGRK